jgi:predicted nucleotidyltransferase
MAIPEEQLSSWAKRGSVQGSSQTYQLLKETLEDPATQYHGKDYEVFLQGSYGNETNIIGESDVDVVIVLNDCWQKDLEKLSDVEKDAYDKAYIIAPYDHAAFKSDVLTVLKNEYGKDKVKAENKAIFVPESDARRNADVIAAIRYRRYFKFNGVNDQTYDEGICFYDKNGTRIANYPKQHSDNLTVKHQASDGRLKPLIRIVKNARTKLVSDGVLTPAVAPSYFLECLMYNVPDDVYDTSYSTSLLSVLNWIQQADDETKKKWVTVNEQYYLFWNDTPTAWPRANFDTFMSAMIELWDNW